MDEEKLEAKILAKRPDLGKEKLAKLVDDMLLSTPFLTRTGALLIISQESGLTPDELGSRQLDDYSLTKIADLTAGLRSVNLVGRLLSLYVSQAPAKRRLVRLKLGDETGKIEVVCWEEKAEAVLSLGLLPGEVVLVQGGYVRLSKQTGLLEVSLQREGSVERTELGHDLPPLTRFFQPVSVALDLEDEFVDVAGVLLVIGRLRRVEASGRRASLREAVITDGKRECILTVWEEALKGLAEAKPLDMFLVSALRRREDGFSTTYRTQVMKCPASELDPEMVRAASTRTLARVRLNVLDVVGETIIATDGSSVLRLEADVTAHRNSCLDCMDAVRVQRRGKTYVYARDIVVVSQSECGGIDMRPVEIVVREDMSPVTDGIIRGVLLTKSPVASVETKYGATKVTSFWLKQGEKVIGGTAWRSKAEELEKVRPGESVEMRWVSLRMTRYGGFELWLDSDSVIEVIKSNPAG